MTLLTFANLFEMIAVHVDGYTTWHKQTVIPNPQNQFEMGFECESEMHQFKKLVEFCKENHMEMTILSDILDERQSQPDRLSLMRQAKKNANVLIIGFYLN